MTTKDIVRDYIAKWPTLQVRTLAQKIYTEYPNLFNSIDQARSMVRYHTGRNGERDRNKVAEVMDITPENPYSLPSAYQEDWTPYYLPKHYTKILVLSDIHLPYHDMAALTLAIEWGKRHQVNCLLLNGDAVDYYRISTWGQDPGRPSVKAELDMMHEMIQVFRRELGCPIVYKYGNHEERIIHYLRRKAPELYDLLEYRPEKLYNWDDFGVEIVSDQRIIYAGKLAILHGHEMKIQAINVNPARSAFLKGKQSCVVGHSHRVSEHSESSLAGKLMTTWSTGCLCQLHPEYSRVNNWSHGFACIDVHDDGGYHVKNLRIYNGRII